MTCISYMHICINQSRYICTKNPKETDSKWLIGSTCVWLWERRRDWTSAQPDRSPYSRERDCSLICAIAKRQKELQRIAKRQKEGRQRHVMIVPEHVYSVELGPVEKGWNTPKYCFFSYFLNSNKLFDHVKLSILWKIIKNIRGSNEQCLTIFWWEYFLSIF